MTFVNGQANKKKKYNLDFNIYNTEKKSAEGWFEKGFFKPVGMEQISENNYAGKVVSDNGGKFGWVFTKIPVRYKGDSVKLVGSIKTENVRKGFAGLVMRVDGFNKSYAFDNSSSRQISGTNDWMRYSITLPLIKNAWQVVVGGMVTGKGTAWFDDFEVFIDGVNIENLKEQPLNLTYISKISDSLKHIFEGSKKEIEFNTDTNTIRGLKPLIDKVGDKKIVSIGEDTHGTSEFYKLRIALTKSLIKEKGFKTLVLENPYDDVELLFAELKSGNLEELMKKHLFSIYQTEEMKDFLTWLRSEGSNLSVKFKGCDDSYWVMDQLLDKEIKTIDNSGLNELYSVFKNLVQSTNPNSQKKGYKRGNDIYKSLLAIDAYMLAENMHNARTKELMVNATSSYYNYKQVSEGKPTTSRDETMANRITFLAQNSDDKIIVWAHNAHISNEIIIDNEIGLMGNVLKDRFADDYFSIGLSSLNGTYTYMDNTYINNDHNYDDDLKSGTLSLQPKFTWESLMGENDDSSFFIISEDVKRELKENVVFGRGKLLGYAKESKEDYYDLNPFSMFDGLIFVKNTTATNPLTY